MNCQREGCCDNIENLQIQQTIFEKNEAKKYADAIAYSMVKPNKLAPNYAAYFIVFT